MSSFQERLKELRGSTSQAKFAEILGIPQTTLGRYERGDSQPDVEFVSQTCLNLGVNPNWLLLGVGPMHGNAVTASAPAPMAEGKALNSSSPRSEASYEVHGSTERNGIIECADCQIMMMPMVEARLSAGTGSFETGGNVERRYAFRMDFLLRKGQPSHMVLMRVSGDSMEPEVKHNDVVLIDQSQCAPRPGLLYAVGVEDAVYLKVINTVPGKLVMTSYNPAYPPIEIDARGDLANGIRIIGRAVWVGRELN